MWASVFGSGHFRHPGLLIQGSFMMHMIYHNDNIGDNYIIKNVIILYHKIE